MSGVAYDITGDATFHYYVDSQSAIVATAATATIGSARAFVQFANAATGGLLYASSWTATGAGVAGTTGTRFYVSENAIMYVNGGGINLFPGSVAGAGTNSGTAPYGLYI